MSYAQQCLDLAAELAGTLDVPGQDAARAVIETLGFSGWIAWRQEHADVVQAFVLATPAQRLRVKKYESIRPLLHLAGYQHCLHAEALLTAAMRLPARGASYRGMAAEAGALACQLEDPADAWPWGDNPFDGTFDE